MVQVNRVCLKILFINRPQFLVDSNGFDDICLHIFAVNVVAKLAKAGQLVDGNEKNEGERPMWCSPSFP